MSWRDQGEIVGAQQQQQQQPLISGSWRDQGEVVGEAPKWDEEAYKQSESYRQSKLKANEEMLLAQAHKMRSESNLPSFKTSMVKLGSGVMSPIYRATGQPEKAEQMVRFGAAAEEAQQEMEKGGIVPDWAQRGARNIGESLATAVTAAPAGPAGIIGTFSAQQADQAYVEGKDAGLEGTKLAAHVTKMASYEALPALIAQRLGIGGLEKILGKGGSKVFSDGLKAAFKQTGKDITHETIEELATSLLQARESVESGVSPHALKPENLRRLILDTVVGAAGGTAAASVPSLAAARKQGRYNEVRSEILKAAESSRAPSVRQWKSWRLPGGKSRTTRKEGVKEIAAAIKEAEQAAEAEAVQQEQPEAAEEPGQIPQGPQQAVEATPEVTSIANAPVSEQRATRGEEPLPAAEPETFQQWLDEAQRQITESPSKPGRLVEELLEHPRGIDKIESAILNVQYAKLKKENNAAAQALYEAQASGNKAEIKRAQNASNTILGEVRNVERVTKRSGAEQARGLVARKMVIKPDFSLGSVVQGLRVAKGGKELNAIEMAKAQKISEEALKNEAEQEALTESIKAQDTEAGIERLIERSKPKKSFKEKSAAKTAEAKAQVKDAIADFKEKLAQKRPKDPGQFLAEESGAVDLDLMESGVKLAVAYANLGVSTFVEFYANVQSQLGVHKAAGRARDSLKAAWKFAQEKGVISRPEVDPNDARAVNRFARQVTKSIVETGITGRDEVVDAVHEELQAILPDITRREAMDAISGYGIYTELSKDQAAATVRDLSGQLRQLSKLEDIRSGKAPRKTGVERRTPSEEEAQLTEQVNEAMRKGGFREVDDAARTAAYKKSLTKRITDLERRISEGDFSKPEKRKTKLDEDATALKYEAKELRNRLDAMEEQFRASQLKGLRKLGRITVETSNLTRAMKTSMDLSALLRQAKFAVLASYKNPKLIRDTTFNMIKSFWSKEMAFNISEELKNDPMTMRGDEAGLAITEVDGELTTQEEGFRGILSQHIPGVAGSERAYVVGLNTMRRGYFKALMESMEAGNAWRPGGQVTDEEAKGIAHVVNVFTGRGRLTGSYQSATEFLSTFMFAPRFVASRFQIALGQPMWGGNARTKKLVAEQYAKAMGGMTAIYSLAAVGGLFALKDEDRPQFEWDSRSSEFGKIRWGEVVLDPFAGLGQVITVISRLVPGFWGEAKYKASTGEILSLSPEGRPFAGPTWSKVAWKFLRSKLAPIPGAIWNAGAGENIIGNETNAYKEMVDLPIPLSFGDVYDALHAKGFGTKAALVTLAIFGDGINRYQNANADDFARKITLHPELEGVREKTGKRFSYTEAVQQMVAQAEKRGITLGELLRVQDRAMSRAGKKFEAKRKKERLLTDRFHGR